MTTDEPRNVLVCQAVRDGPPPLPSKRFFCVECGDGVWVSARVMSGLVMKGEVAPVCEGCGAIAANDPDAEFQLHPAQEAELQEHGILEFSKAMVKAMRERKDGRTR